MLNKHSIGCYVTEGGSPVSKLKNSSNKEKRKHFCQGDAVFIQDATVGEDAYSGPCVICGCYTQNIGTVYMTEEHRSARRFRHYRWVEVTLPLCEHCVLLLYMTDSTPFLIYLALQACWLLPIQHGLTVVSFFGICFTLYGFYRLITRLLDRWWMRTRSNQPAPEFFRDKTSQEERSSIVLKDYLKKHKAEWNTRIETINEHCFHQFSIR